ncbi:MAG TPA: SDR family oxidoreductase [Candidatus Limnocylindrales bacterium]|nr:SDR family oxidoreductase [Candidatus Limnocylindrales bacterium]
MPDAEIHQPWALILGASSGFGEAAALALAADGYDVAGVHLDRRQGLAHVAEITARIASLGREAHFVNINAADDERRAEFLTGLRERFQAQEAAGRRPYVRVLLHSLAFGTLKPFLADDAPEAISRKNMEMTLDVMAHSLVYWAQDLWRGGFLAAGSKLYAMTSEGSSRMIESYGAVSAAKCALESHCRQLAMEFARLGSGVTVNAIRAGVTVTHALMQIPEREKLIEHARTRNPSGRMTTVDDVAQAIVTFSQDGTDWMTGNVIGIDGGELIAG